VASVFGRWDIFAGIFVFVLSVVIFDFLNICYTPKLNPKYFEFCFVFVNIMRVKKLISTCGSFSFKQKFFTIKASLFYFKKTGKG
jgi:hypothetical protein